MVENVRPDVEVKTGNVAIDVKSNILFRYNSELHLVYAPIAEFVEKYKLKYWYILGIVFNMNY